MRDEVTIGRRGLGRAALAAALLAVLALGGCGDPGDGTTANYRVTFSVGGSRLIGALQFDVVLVGIRGEFVGWGSRVDCVSRVDALFAANHQGDGRLLVGLASLAGFRAPTAVVDCIVRSADVPTTESFEFRVADVADTQTNAILPIPPVTATAVVALD